RGHRGGGGTTGGEVTGGVAAGRHRLGLLGVPRCGTGVPVPRLPVGGQQVLGAVEGVGQLVEGTASSQGEVRPEPAVGVLRFGFSPVPRVDGWRHRTPVGVAEITPGHDSAPPACPDRTMPTRASRARPAKPEDGPPRDPAQPGPDTPAPPPTWPDPALNHSALSLAPYCAT